MSKELPLTITKADYDAAVQWHKGAEDQLLSVIYCFGNHCPFWQAVNRTYPELKVSEVTSSWLFSARDRSIGFIRPSFSPVDMYEVAEGTEFKTTIHLNT